MLRLAVARPTLHLALLGPANACPEPGAGSGEFQTQGVLFPIALEYVHVVATQDLFERAVAGGIVAVVGHEFPVEFPQQALLLEIVAQVSGLGVVGSLVFFVKLFGRGRAESFERGDALAVDRFLQAAQTPIGVTDDPPLRLARLLVQ